MKVKSLSPVRAARQASLPMTTSSSLPKLMSIESVMPSNHLILCHPLLLLPPIPPNIRVFSSESALRIRWPKYWSFTFSISPSNEYSGLISFRIDWFDLLAVQGTLKSLLQSLNPPHIPVNNSPQLSLIERHLFPTGFWLIQLALESLHSATTPLSIRVAALESRSPSYEAQFDLLLVM